MHIVPNLTQLFKKTTSTTKATMLYALFFNTLLTVAMYEKCEDVSKRCHNIFVPRFSIFLKTENLANLDSWGRWKNFQYFLRYLYLDFSCYQWISNSWNLETTFLWEIPITSKILFKLVWWSTFCKLFEHFCLVWVMCHGLAPCFSSQIVSRAESVDLYSVAYYKHLYIQA